ncbi:class F sortase [Candidatus Kaiserbacteria bacterium]|nr:class F sortase [Candidatus Kaiserbacteria bacterium]
MRNRLVQYLKEHQAVRRRVRVAAFAVLGIGFGLVLGYTLHSKVTLDLGRDITNDVAPEIIPTGPVLARALPTHLTVRRAGIDADFEAPLGLNPDQTVQVPEAFDTVGWYQYGPTPGELGPAVVFGHVDSYQGPAVFFSIGQLEHGDVIEVVRDDGNVALFEVNRIGRYGQEDFPTNEVYGNIPYAGLRLVTCSGVYDKNTKRYSHNTVVYASLVGVENGAPTGESE